MRRRAALDPGLQRIRQQRYGSLPEESFWILGSFLPKFFRPTSVPVSLAWSHPPRCFSVHTCECARAGGGMNSSSAARYFPGILARRNGNGAHSETSDYVESLTPESGTEQIAEAEDTDEVLILRLQKKDVVALGLLYRRYARLIYSVCARILRNHDAEDLV